MDTKLANRVVLVTGASGGIGGELVRAFVREGARVVAHFGEHGDRADALHRELGALCVPLGADLTLEAEVERLFAEIEAGLGPVEVLVANAGWWPPDDVPLAEMTLKQWNNTLAVNLTSVFLCLREFCRGIVKNHNSNIIHTMKFVLKALAEGSQFFRSRMRTDRNHRPFAISSNLPFRYHLILSAIGGRETQPGKGFHGDRFHSNEQ